MAEAEQPQQQQKVFPRTTGWRRVLISTTAAGLGAVALLSAIAALIGGSEAAYSAAAGGGAVVVLSAISLAIIDVCERRAPHLTMAMFMLGFCLKIAALAMLLPLMDTSQWLQPAWALGAGIGVLVLWQTVEIMTFARLRVTVEPDA